MAYFSKLLKLIFWDQMTSFLLRGAQGLFPDDHSSKMILAYQNREHNRKGKNYKLLSPQTFQ